MDEDAIDDELKCIVCTQPLQSPVSLACQHIFCELCIETWIKTNASCPICRRQFVTKYTLTTMKNSTLCNQLDSLLIRCLRCNKTGIRRIDFTKHVERCSKSRMKTVSHLFHNRWCFKTRSMQSKPDRQVTSHQTQVVSPAEVVHTNHEQRDIYLQNDEQQFSDLRPRTFQETTFSRSTILRLHHERRLNRQLTEASERKRTAIFYICIYIFAIWFLTIFGGTILIFLQRLGLVIVLLFSVWLFIKPKRRN
ncbi:unnamed protein product [Rotaria sp. Silwood1]|nr:unnamed protein product [Rotaria sp. Silwood1]